MSKPEWHISLAIGPNCDMESFALRSALEYFGVRVCVHWIGRPSDFVDVLSGADREAQVDYLILNFHGEEGKFCMPELSEDIYEKAEPRGEFFSAQEIIQYANLANVKVIAMGCTLGEKQLAQAFIQRGSPSYLGPADYIDGNANFMFVMRFIYELIANKKTEKEAFASAASMDQETSLYKLYSSKDETVDGEE
ncbi:hypothetical protein SAMN05421736_101488 [Evansella caseinilytica]|uniref:Delta-aminolevulinic acid dehydratase n=1 Tax=Evansella caseinilytica TaxID=1503961 RepID=A0A1H3HFU4_9BACI|nr:delta-aminolevulinic acid dehydratase [Evansella caseinilytica]SDY14443.1 hypothetical protein SAMN05421736_101488 [Evansella caseinilytica]